MLSDIEISRAAALRPIHEIAAKLEIPDAAIEPVRHPRTRRAVRQAYPRHRDQPHPCG
jgi:formyltetrahydrofolate synthetase